MLIDKEKLKNNFTLYGNINNPYKYLRHSKIIMNSFNGGSPMYVLGEIRLCLSIVSANTR